MYAAGSVELKDEKGRVVREDYDKSLDKYYGDVVLVGTRSVRLRMVNRNLVIPEQVNELQRNIKYFFLNFKCFSVLALFETQ